MPNVTVEPRKVARLLFIALAANAAGHSFVLVVLPGLARRLGFSDLQAGVLIGLSALVMTLAAPVWGTIGDRSGRRRLFLAGLLSGCVFLGVAAVLVSWRFREGISAQTTFVLLFTARLLQSCFAGGLSPATQAIVADITVADRRAGGMGLMGAAFGIGSVLGGMVAWWLAADNPVIALTLLAVVIAASTLFSAISLPETHSDTSIHPLNKIDLAKGSARFLAVTLLALSTYAALQQVTVLRLQDGFGLSPDVAMRTGGAVMMTSMAAMVTGLLVLVRHLAWSARRFCRVGATGATVCLIVAALTTSLPILFITMAGFGVCLGLLMPGNLAQISLRAGAAQASAAGLNAVAQGFGMALGPIAGAALHRFSPQAPYAAAAVALACCVLAVWHAPEPFAN
ncbi:MAG: MFS transporter [Rhodospirillaceae bacterium]|nr:MFS transporter [Rhodospirillaceae bacterium]